MAWYWGQNDDACISQAVGGGGIYVAILLNQNLWRPSLILTDRSLLARCLCMGNARICPSHFRKPGCPATTSIALEEVRNYCANCHQEHSNWVCHCRSFRTRGNRDLMACTNRFWVKREYEKSDYMLASSQNWLGRHARKPIRISKLKIVTYGYGDLHLTRSLIITLFPEARLETENAHTWWTPCERCSRRRRRRSWYYLTCWVVMFGQR